METTNTIRIGKALDRRIKLREEQRKQIIKDYATSLYSMHELARLYQVDRGTISDILYPERAQQKAARQKNNKNWLKYYSREKRKLYMRNHRAYKKQLQKKGLI